MAGEWREVPIGELAEIFDGPHATPPKTSHGPVFLGISNLSNGRINLGNTEHLSEDDYKRWTRRVEPQAGDIVFSYETRLGEAALIPLGLRCCLGRRTGLLRARSREINRRFLLYAYLGPQFQETLRSRTIHGSTVDRIPLIDMPGFPIEIPSSLDEQRAIAHILGTLDDKIELNRQMSETLEAMARALFKSWFVDFDPVRAKAQGRDRGLPQPLADLFPSRLVDSKLGEIPEGWGVGRFGDVVEQLRDQENPLSSPDVLYHHFSIPAFDEGQTPKLEYGESIKSLKLRVAPGVVLLSKLNPEIDRVWFVDVGSTDRAVCSTEFLVLRARTPFTRSFVYCFARSSAFRQQVEALVTGTSKSHQRVQVDSILNLGVVVAPAAIVDAFNLAAESLLARTLTCRRESRAVVALRDALLPQLISGELRVKDPERFIEIVTGSRPATQAPVVRNPGECLAS
jgi:type I restriction enzyme S subunit